MRLIDADAGVDYLQMMAQNCRNFGMHTSAVWHDTMASLLNNARCFPTIDATPVVHARWEYNPGDNVPYCSGCAMPQDAPTNYCHNCGAKMDAEEDES